MFLQFRWLIILKTNMFRLKTFARFGLQQIQVDCHYLQLYLWRFVEDEVSTLGEGMGRTRTGKERGEEHESTRRSRGKYEEKERESTRSRTRTRTGNLRGAGQESTRTRTGNLRGAGPVSYTHLTLPTNREV